MPRRWTHRAHRRALELLHVSPALDNPARGPTKRKRWRAHHAPRCSISSSRARGRQPGHCILLFRGLVSASNGTSSHALLRLLLTL